jgi:hypothetical protein
MTEEFAKTFLGSSQEGSFTVSIIASNSSQFDLLEQDISKVVNSLKRMSASNRLALRKKLRDRYAQIKEHPDMHKKKLDKQYHATIQEK